MSRRSDPKVRHHVHVVKEREGAIVRRVHLCGDDGQPITTVTRFLDHLAERGYSPFTLAAYAYDLQNLFVFLASVSLAWQAFRPADALRFLTFLRRRPTQRAAQRSGLALIVDGETPGRRLSASTVNRILAGVASFYDWAIAVEARKPMGRQYLFEEPLAIACRQARLVDGQGRPTVTAHRFRHTVGTQLAEGGARIQTIMAILGHRSAQMSATYSRVSDPTVREQYEQIIAAGARIAGPAAEALVGSPTRQCHHRLAQDELLQDRARARALPAAAPRRTMRMRPLPPMLQVLHHY